MILTVTPNPALDSTITLDELDLGESHRVAPAVTRAGGKGINVARVLVQRGFDTLAIAPVGENDLAEFERDLGPVPAVLLPVPGRPADRRPSSNGRPGAQRSSTRPVAKSRVGRGRRYRMPSAHDSPEPPASSCPGASPLGRRTPSSPIW